MERLRDQFTVPAQGRVGRDDRGQLRPDLAANGLFFHSPSPTLIVVEQQLLATGLLQQGLHLGLLELDDLLLTRVEDATNGHKQNVARPEQEGQGCRRTSASLQGCRMKSTAERGVSGAP